MVDKETEVHTKGLRASNTVQTLKPTEVAIGPTVLETFNESSPGVVGSEQSVLNLVLPTDDGHYDYEHDEVSGTITVRRMETVYGTPEENLKKLMQGRFDELPKNDDCFAYYEPESDQSSLARRVQKLEEQMDALLDRLQKYNVRAQHRI